MWRYVVWLDYPNVSKEGSGFIFKDLVVQDEWSIPLSVFEQECNALPRNTHPMTRLHVSEHLDPPQNTAVVTSDLSNTVYTF
jgi:hypothetical protein